MVLRLSEFLAENEGNHLTFHAIIGVVAHGVCPKKDFDLHFFLIFNGVQIVGP